MLCPTSERLTGERRAGRTGRGSPATDDFWLLGGVLHALLAGDGLARPLAGAGVGAGPLAAQRQAAAVADAAVAADVLQAGDVLLDFPLQRPLDSVFAVED